MHRSDSDTSRDVHYHFGCRAIYDSHIARKRNPNVRWNRRLPWANWRCCSDKQLQKLDYADEHQRCYNTQRNFRVRCSIDDRWCSCRWCEDAVHSLWYSAQKLQVQLFVCRRNLHSVWYLRSLFHSLCSGDTDCETTKQRDSVDWLHILLKQTIVRSFRDEVEDFPPRASRSSYWNLDRLLLALGDDIRENSWRGALVVQPGGRVWKSLAWCVHHISKICPFLPQPQGWVLTKYATHLEHTPTTVCLTRIQSLWAYSASNSRCSVLLPNSRYVYRLNRCNSSDLCVVDFDREWCASDLRLFPLPEDSCKSWCRYHWDKKYQNDATQWERISPLLPTSNHCIDRSVFHHAQEVDDCYKKNLWVRHWVVR